MIGWGDRTEALLMIRQSIERAIGGALAADQRNNAGTSPGARSS
jgi:hypothetical protein